MIKAYIHLIILIILLSCNCISGDNSISSVTSKSIPEKQNNTMDKLYKSLRHSTLFNNKIKYTNYFYDTKTVNIKNIKKNLYIWGKLTVEKGTITLTITNPRGENIYQDTFSPLKENYIELKFSPLKGKWIFSITCHNTKGEYQIMTGQM